MSARRTIALRARQELALAVRSRWTQVFAAVFAALALAVAAAGYVLSGSLGVQDFARTAVSLVQLVLLLRLIGLFVALAASVALWALVPSWLALRRLERADI